MQQMIIKTAISMLVSIVMNSKVFAKIEESVNHWEKVEVANHEKQDGVFHDMAVFGIKETAKVIKLGIKLAIIKMDLLNK